MKMLVKKIFGGFNRKSGLLFLVAASMMLLGTALYFFAKKNYWLKNEYNSQAQNTELNNQVTLLLLYIKNTESALRGYVITGDKKFAEIFNENIDSIHTAYIKAQQSEARKNNTTQSALFLKSDSLIEKKIGFMQRVKSLCDNNDFKAATALFATNEGQYLSDSITKINETINHEIQAELRQSRIDFQVSGNRNNRLAYFSIAASMLLIFFVIYLLIKEIRRTRKTRDELRIQKENYRVTLNSLGEGLITTDNHGRVMYMNPIAEQLTGWNWQEAKNQPLHRVFNVTNEETGKAFTNVASRILMEKKKVEWENNTILQSKNSENFIIRNTGTPITDIHGNISGAVLVFSDMTEEDRIHKALIENEKQYRTLIQNLPEAVYTCDASGYIQLFNKAAVDLWGRVPAAGKDLWCGSWKIFNTDGTDLPLDSCPMAICLKEGRPVYGKEIMVQRPDENLRHVLPYPSPLFNADGQLTGAINMLIDVTDKKEREILIRKNEEKYLAIFNNSLDGIALSSPDGRIFAVNPAACVLLDRTEEELCSMGRNAVLNENNPGVQTIIDERKQKGKIQGEIKLRKKNGTEFLAEFNSTLFTDVEGNEKTVTTFRDITGRKMAEKEARDFRYALDESSIVTIADPAGRILYANDNFCRISKYTREELIDQKHRIVNSGYHPESFFANLWTTISSGKIWRGEVRNKAKDGSFFWMDTTIVPFLNGSEKPNRYIAIRYDITERKNAEEALLNSRKQFQSLVENISGVYWVNNLETNQTLYISPSYETIWGRKCEDLFRDPADFINAVHPEDREYLLKAFNSVAQTHKANITYRIIRPDGEIRWIAAKTNVVADSNGNKMEYGYAEDITEKKEAENEIKQSEEKYKDLIDNISDLICTHDLDGRILSMNKAAEQLTGTKFNPQANLNIKDILTPGSKNKFESYISEIKNNGHVQNFMKVKLRDGQIRTWEFKNSLKKTGVKDPVVRGYARDITESKRAEELLQKSYEDIRSLAAHLEKVREEERTHIAREIHDELGQQLTVMKMDVSWLDEKLNNTDKKLKQKTETLKDMLDKTVSTVRHLAYELRPSMLDDMGLGSAIEWQLEEFEKRSGVKTKLIEPEKEWDMPDIIKTGLFRIVQESLTNVGRYARAKNVLVHLQQEEEELALTIKDDGIGFDKEKVAEKKTLGILGMKERTLMMGGTYEINSTPGKGTVVTVRVSLKK